MVRVPETLSRSFLQNAQDDGGLRVVVRSEAELAEAIAEAVRDTQDFRGDAGSTYKASLISHEIAVVESFRVTQPIILPGEAWGLRLIAPRGLRFDVEEGLDAIFDVRGVMQEIRDFVFFNEGRRYADNFIRSSNSSFLRVTGCGIFSARRAFIATGTQFDADLSGNWFLPTDGTSANHAIDLAGANNCLVFGNRIRGDGSAIRISAGSRNRIIGNHLGGDTVTTPGNGENTIVGNTGVDIKGSSIGTDAETGNTP